MNGRPPVEVTEVRISDRALARAAGYVAGRTEGVAGLRPALSGRVQSAVRGRTDAALAAVSIRSEGGSTTVSLHLALALDPPPVRTVESVVSRVGAELLRLTGRQVAVEVVVTAIE